MLQLVVLAPAKPAQRRRHRCGSVVRAAIQTLEQRRLFAAPSVTAPDTELFEDWLPLNDGHFHFQVGPQHVKAGFDQSVNVANDALSLTNLTTGTPYTDLSHSGSGTDHTWTVSGADNQGVSGGPLITGALPRGNYELLFNDTGVTNAAGETLDGNTYVPDNGNPDGESGDDYVSGFYVLPGDHNRDRVVDGADYGQLDNYVQFPGTTGYMYGDFNYSGEVTSADYAIIDRWAGTALPEVPTQANTLTAAAGRGFVDLMWTPPADSDIDGFKIYRSLDAGDTWTLRHTLPDPLAASWQDTGLDDGTKYTYRIRAYRETGVPEEPIHYSVTTNKYWVVTNLPGPLDAPTVSDVTHDALTLTWNDNTSNESGFRIEVTGPGGVTSTVLVPARSGEGQTSFRVTGLAPDTAYSFRVHAYITGTQGSAWSPSVGATTTALANPPVPPGFVVAPTGLTATRTDGANLRLDWTDAPNETRYYLERSTDGMNWGNIGDVDANVITFAQNSLVPFTTYYFRVKAHDGQAFSAPSNTATVMTGGTLAAPTGLVANATAEDELVLSWGDASEGEDGFELQRMEGTGGAWQTVTTTAANAIVYTDAGLTADQTYTYRARAVRSTPVEIVSDWSNEATKKTPKLPAPKSLVANAVSSSEINLTWSETVTGEDGFLVEVSSDGGANYSAFPMLPPNARHYSATGLQPETSYKFRVATKKGANLSEYFAVATATTRPVPGPDTDGDGDPDYNPPLPDDPGRWEVVGTVTPSIKEESVRSFGSSPAGQYQVVFDSGMLNYHNGEPQYWGGNHFYGGYKLIVNGEDETGLPAGWVGQETPETLAAKVGTAMGLAHTGGDISVKFTDSPYDDNTGPGITWRLERYHPPQPPEPPVDPNDDPDTDEVDETMPTISLSVNPDHAVATEGGEDFIELVFSRGPGEEGKSRPAVTVEYTLAGNATPQDDYTGPTPGKGFAAVYKVTIPANADEESVEISADADETTEGQETLFASVRATGTYFFSSGAVDAAILDAPMVDLRADSNNDGTITAADNDVEETPPGQIITLNDDDDDGNGMPDYLDDVMLSTGDDDLVEMQWHLPPELPPGPVTLRIGSAGADHVRVWSSRDKAGGPILGPGLAEVELPAGQQSGVVYVEGILPSDNAGDVEFTLAAPPISGSAPTTDRQVKTVSPFSIDVRKVSHNNLNGERLKDDEKRNVGAFLPANNDDDDYSDNGTSKDYGADREQKPPAVVTGENDLLPIIVGKTDNGAAVKVQYSVSKIRLYRQAEGRKELMPSGTEVPTDVELPLYVEGVSPGVTSIQLVQGDKDKPVATLKVTVFAWVGPLNVPQFGTFKYSATGVNGGKWLDPHHGAIVGDGTKPSVSVKWKNGADIGKVIYQANANYVWDLEVNIVEVKVETPPLPPGQTTPFARGTVQQGADTLTQKRITSEGAVPGLSWGAKVTFTGPVNQRIPNQNVQRGINRLRAGFVQNLTVSKHRGIYVGGATAVSSLAETKYWDTRDRNSDLDQDYPEKFYSVVPAALFNPKPGDQTGTIAESDSPLGGPPKFKGTRLQRMELDWDFDLFVAVVTNDERMGGDDVYTAEASVKWEFNATGNIVDDVLTWQGDGAGITVTNPEQGWKAASFDDTLQPITGKPRFNYQINHQQAWK
jgi:hypothetical protein